MSERGNPSFASMVLSVLVLGGIILALFGIGQFFYGSDAPRRDVDFACVAQSARESVEWLLYTPTTVPAGWTSNNAQFNPGDEGSWRLGMVTADNEFIGIEQHFDDVADVVETYAPESEETGRAQVAGFDWDVYESADGTMSFVRTEGEQVIMVTSTAERAIIETYIESLTSESTLPCR